MGSGSTRAGGAVSAAAGAAAAAGGGGRGGGGRGGGGRGGGARRSDMRLKRDIVLLGRLEVASASIASSTTAAPPRMSA